MSVTIASRNKFQKPTTSTLLNNIVAYYKLDESSGSVLDSVNSLNGTNNGAEADPDGGKIGGGYIFSNADYIDMGDQAAFETLTGAGTISAWVYNTGTEQYSMIASKIDFGTDRYGFCLYLFGGTHVRGGVANAATAVYILEDQVDIASNEWEFVVFTWDISDGADGTLKVYVNAGAPYTQNQYISAAFSTQTFRIGDNATWGSSMVGVIDEVGIWSRALTAEEITELYNSNNGKTYPF